MDELRTRWGAPALVVAALASGALFATCAPDGPDPGSDVLRPPVTPAVAAPAPTGAPSTTEPAVVPRTTRVTPAPTTTAVPPVPMTITIDIAPAAVWQDGTPITVADFRCTWRANASTPDAVRADDYASVRDVRAGASDRQVVVELDQPDAAYRTLFDPVIQASAVGDCDDVSAAFPTTMAMSARPYRVDTWTTDQIVLVANEHWWGPPPMTPRVVIARQAGVDAEVAAIAGGQVDAVMAAFDAPSAARLRTEPTLATAVVPGYDFEALYFQQADGPLADATFRAAVAQSIDRAALYADIFEPAFGAAGLTVGLLGCGPAVPGPWCAADDFASSFDPLGAADALQAAGWVRDDGGYWSKDGVVPVLRWVVDEGNATRERAQALLIPRLADAGFRVVADNCAAACVFDQRLPSLDYDIAMYTATAAADPSYLTRWFSCEEVPGPEFGLDGENLQGWCDEAASDVLHRADVTLDPAGRRALVASAIAATASDHVLLPLAQQPAVAAWRPDRVGGAIDAGLSADQGLGDLSTWTDLDGDGQLVVGAEQWPLCPNPVTTCADSSWYRWAVGAQTLPSVWRVDPTGAFVPTELVAAEPQVVAAG